MTTRRFVVTAFRRSEPAEAGYYRRLRWLPVVFALGLTAGCSQEYPEDLEYSFTPYTKKDSREGKDVKEIFDVPAPARAELVQALKPFFGTPRHPVVMVDDKLKNHAELQLDPKRLEMGSGLYRKLCLYCHGINGDASGPTGPFLEPRPRDFREGSFKFRSTSKVAPSREDLKKTIRSGVPGASMPSFNVLSEDELEALASYVIHLALRGQVQKELANSLQAGGDISDVEGVVKFRAQAWADDAQKRVQPQVPAGGWEKVHAEGVHTNFKRGQRVYETTGACVECHGRDGRSSVMENPINATRRNDWGDLNPPRDLTLGVYRGGSRPIDIFLRIRWGIVGSGMPQVSDQVTDEEIWHLVDFVMSLPQKRH